MIPKLNSSIPHDRDIFAIAPRFFYQHVLISKSIVWNRDSAALAASPIANIINIDKTVAKIDK
ncbi:hypothetical protein [Chamaesiphon sp. OTE_75_metabat_556]|uniref:hypothetical protein n=1 Tax=Chamaesiphon sp. OTE_75_metabat_556 TaxID=2964692 RepID=UPI00286AECFD|nr:hypothetical protein [Chamaesiphon sp. OTE_75_metabat_556]